jgi:hypothetical protein
MPTAGSTRCNVKSVSWHRRANPPGGRNGCFDRLLCSPLSVGDLARARHLLSDESAAAIQNRNPTAGTVAPQKKVMSAIGTSANVMICPKCHSDFGPADGCKREVPSPLPSSRAARKHTPEAKTPKFCPLGCMKFARNCKMVLLRPIFRFGVSIDWNVSATPFETKNCSSCSSVISSILSGISRRAEHLALITPSPASINPLRLPTGARLQQPQRLWRPKREDHLRLCPALAARCNRVS